MKNKMVHSVFSVVFIFASCVAAYASTLSEVRERGVLRCGINPGLPGFASSEQDEEWEGLDVDYCKAVAAAIFNGDASKVQYFPLTTAERFTWLQEKKIDLLARNTTWTMYRDAALNLEFAGVNYYDGQGFMVRTEMNINSALELSGAPICVQRDTTTETNLIDYFNSKDMELKALVLDTKAEFNEAYEQGRCDAITTDLSGLYSLRLNLADPQEHRVLPEVVSKEPLGPVVRDDDPQWLNIVRWVHFGLLNAEEFGVTQDNVASMLDSSDADIRRLIGTDGAFGEQIGLTNDWLANVIGAVGNYGEIFERNVGPDTALGIQRGINALWTDGGLMYAPPIQ